MSTAKSRRILGACLVAALALQPVVAAAQPVDAGAYGGARIDGKTEVEKAIGGCAAALIIGALAGAAVAGKNNRGQGALIGAGAGGLLCAAMMSIASKRDKEQLRVLQLQALNTGQQQTSNWQTADNKAVSAIVQASDVVEVTAPKTSEVLRCRRVSTTLRVDEAASDTTDVVCLQGDSWMTIDKLKATGVRSKDIAV